MLLLILRSPLAIRNSPSVPKTLVHYWVQRRIEETVDQAGGGVIGAGGLAFVAAGGLEFEGAVFRVDLRVKFEKGFVDAAQFLGAEVLIIDRATDALINSESQYSDRLKQETIGDVATNYVGDRFVRPEKRPERGETKFGTALIGPEFLEDQGKPAPEIDMLGSSATFGQMPQTGG